jgi:C-terminal processing protease CtpA/Prc
MHSATPADRHGARSLVLCFVVALAGCAASQGTIGAVIGQQRGGRLFLREVPKNLAADQAGLREGDEVLLIDGRDVRAMAPEQVHAALSGDVGQPVKLTLVRGDQVIRETLRRTPARKRLGAASY